MRTRLALACLTSLGLAIGVAGSADALGSARWPFKAGPGTYYFYGNDSVSGGLATATTTVGGTPCLMYTRSVSTAIRLPNGSHASRSSLLGQCSSSISIARGSYGPFQIKSTHSLQLWNGSSWSYVD